MKVADVITRYLVNEVSPSVEIASRGKGRIPHFDLLLDYASKLDVATEPAACAMVIRNLLGRASSVNFEQPPHAWVPDPQNPQVLIPHADAVTFPRDHHFHLGMGAEWYWLACTLEVRRKNDGRTGRLSVLASLEKDRVVSPVASDAAGWTPEEATIGTCFASATVNMDPDATPAYYAARCNQQWPAKGGRLGFSRPGENFHVAIGQDRIERVDSTMFENDVLPLRLTLASDPALKTDLVFAANPTLIGTAQSWFLQGVPSPTLNGGTGLTPEPTPGIYYSWPQLAVTGTVWVKGIEYEVLSGEGWIDHQLMQQSLVNSWKLGVTPPVRETTPVPFVGPAPLYNGWTWQYFNLSNNGAFTGASFFNGPSVPNPLSWQYGYVLTPSTSSGWLATFVLGGTVTLSNPQQIPTPCGDVTLWLDRAYSIDLIVLNGSATPWGTDGSLDFNGSIGAEFPADFNGTLLSNLVFTPVEGSGYLESVGFENTEMYTESALRFLGKQMP